MSEIIEEMVEEAVQDYNLPHKKYYMQKTEETPGARELSDYIQAKQLDFYKAMEKDLRENYMNEYLCPEDFTLMYEDWYWPSNMKPCYKIQMIETRELQRRMAMRYREEGQQLEFWFIYTGVI